jgi:hypothetical protein
LDQTKKTLKGAVVPISNFYCSTASRNELLWFHREKKNPCIIVGMFEKYDLWRNHPAIVGRPRHMFPGLGLAAGIFAVYLVADFAYDKYVGGDKHHHGDGHHHHGEAKAAHH